MAHKKTKDQAKSKVNKKQNPNETPSILVERSKTDVERKRKKALSRARPDLLLQLLVSNAGNALRKKALPCPYVKVLVLRDPSGISLFVSSSVRIA